MGNRVQAQEYYLTPGGGPTVEIRVTDERGDPMPGLPVYAFDGATYTGYHETTDGSGIASITLPEGIYRFRVDVDSTQFWSGEANHCPVPGCTLANVTVTIPVVVTVLDSMGMPQEGLPVYAFDGTTYTGYHGTSDANGQVTLTLPQGDYRFRADSGGTQFWSGEVNHCSVPGCESASGTVDRKSVV